MFHLLLLLLISLENFILSLVFNVLLKNYLMHIILLKYNSIYFVNVLMSSRIFNN